MIDALTRLDDLGRYGAGSARHLPECPHSRLGRVEDCEWCRWAALTPELTTLVELGRDAGVLAVSDAADTVAGVVAAAAMFDADQATRTGRDPRAVGSRLAERVRVDTMEELREARTPCPPRGPRRVAPSTSGAAAPPALSRRP